jgi:hypothetical protein
MEKYLKFIARNLHLSPIVMNKLSTFFYKIAVIVLMTALFSKPAAAQLHLYGGLNGLHFYGDKSFPAIGPYVGVAYSGNGSRAFTLSGSYLLPSFYTTNEEAIARNGNVTPTELEVKVRHYTRLQNINIGYITYLLDDDFTKSFNIYFNSFTGVIFGKQYDRVIGASIDDYNVQGQVLTEKSLVLGLLVGAGLGMEYDIGPVYIFVEPYAAYGGVGAARPLSPLLFGFKAGVHHVIEL